MEALFACETNRFLGNAPGGAPCSLSPFLRASDMRSVGRRYEMIQIPNGFVTFLFTDIENSTRLWEERPDAMWESLKRHDALMREAIEAQDGYIFKTVGDAFCATFKNSESAVKSAVGAQLALHADPLLNGTDPQGVTLRVRMGLHCGEPMCTGADYFGPPVNRAARVSGVAYGGQIVLSSIVASRMSAAMPETISFKELGLCRLKDLPEPETLTQVLHPGLPYDFPPLPSLSNCPNNLPNQLTPFLGRHNELFELESLLAKHIRLVSIIGPGGSGKTRLALQTATEVMEKYPGGVWWADLSYLTEFSQVIPAIANVLGLREIPQRSLVEQIAERLRRAPTLLILDNFEQVIDAAPEIDSLLRQCPPLYALVTTRSALNLSGEHEFPLSEMTQEEAAQLFAIRTKQTRPDFALDQTSRPIVERIIQRLDFNPLALELAAAQARLLSIAQIEKQLSERFRLLVSPYRDISQRQKTLRGAIDWSYELLGEQEKSLFQQFSVFTGSFTLEDALAGCEGEDTLGGLMRLRDQSLLRMEERDERSTFRMLESLKEYGLEKLRSEGKEQAVRGRLADYFANLAANLTSETPDIGAVPNLLLHRDSFRASLSWLIQNKESANGAKLCLAMKPLWERQGAFREGRLSSEKCLGFVTEPESRARLNQNIGWFAFRSGEFDEAGVALEVSRRQFVELGLSGEVSKVQNDLALIAQAQGRNEEARGLFNEAIRQAEESGDELRHAMRLNNLGNLDIQEGRVDEACKHLTKAFDIYESRGDLHGAAVCLCNLSDQALSVEKWDEALDYASQGEARFRLLNDERSLLCALINKGQAAAKLGKTDVVVESVSEALPLCLEAEHRSEMPGLIETLISALTQRTRGEELAPIVAIGERIANLISNPIGEALKAEIEEAIKRFPERYEEERKRLAKLTLEEMPPHIAKLLQKLPETKRTGAGV